MKLMRVLIFLSLTILCLPDFLYCNNSTKHSLRTIPSNELDQIKLLFEKIFKNEPFAHTLFFDKPISFSSSLSDHYTANQALTHMNIDEYAEHILSGYEPSQIFVKQWAIWEKNKGLFKMSKYLFFKTKVGEIDVVLLVNKQSFESTFNKHLALFQKVLNKPVTAEDLLNEIKKENSDLWDILNHHHGLLGILLGFGKHNAMVFKLRETLEHKLAKISCITLPEYHQDLKNRIEILWNTLKPLDANNDINLTLPYRICFVGDHNHLETAMLEQLYRNNNRKLSEIFSKDDWFEKIITQLCL